MADSTTIVNGSSTSFDSVTNVTSHVTEVFSFEERRPTADYSALVVRLDVCRRLPPPPIPPWLMESPEKLRHLVANCSSWRKYTDLCSIHIPPEYPQALANGLHSGSHAVQWIPFIIVIFLVTLIVVSVIITYIMYRSNRMKCPFLNGYLPGPQPHNYCMPSGSMTTSVTIETQLSVCALEDDAMAAMTPLHLTYMERVHQAHQDVPHFCPGHLQEILLHPAELQNRDSPGPHFVSDLSSSQYYSSQSLPIITDKASLAKSRRRNLSSDSLSLDSDDADCSAPNYVHIHAGNESLVTSNSNSNDFVARKKTVRGIMKRCQKAGVYLVHGVLGHRQTTSKNDGKTFTQVKGFPTFTKIRRSFKQLKLPNHRQFTHSKSYDSGIACQENLENSEEAKIECDTLSSYKAKINTNSSSISRSRIRSSFMKRFRPLSRLSAREQLAGEITPESQSHDYAVMSSYCHTDMAVKTKKSPLKKLKVPNLFRNLTKHREFI